MDVRERNLFTDRLTPAEIAALARRAGGVSRLVAPTRLGEIEAKSDAEIVGYLAEDPKRLRRPIIDTGVALHLGFSRKVRDALGGA